MQTVFVLVAIFAAGSGATVLPLQTFSNREQCVVALQSIIVPYNVAYFNGTTTISLQGYLDLDCVAVSQ